MTWDERYQDERYHLHYPSEAVVRFLAANRDGGRKVIDIGCGAARHLMAALHMGFNPTGVDISPTAVEVSLCLVGPPVLVAPMHALPFPADSFDLAISYGVYYYGSRLGMEAAIAELHRILKPGGKALVVTATTRDWRKSLGGVDEYGQQITLIDRPTAGWLFRAFSSVQIDSQEFTIGGRRNSHWVITVTK